MNFKLDEKYSILIKKINIHLSDIESITNLSLEDKKIPFDLEIEKAFVSNLELKDLLKKSSSFIDYFLQQINEFDKYKLINKEKEVEEKLTIDLEKFKKLKLILEDYKELYLLSLKEKTLFLNSELMNETFGSERYKKINKEYDKILDSLSKAINKSNFGDIDSLKDDLESIKKLPISLKESFGIKKIWVYVFIILFIISIILISVGAWVNIV